MDDLKRFFSQPKNMLLSLIAINAFVFLTNRDMPLVGGSFNPLAMILSIFSHADFSHILFNMFALYIFGSLILRHVKSWHLLVLYLFSGILGNIAFMIFFQGTKFQLLGASGAVYGIMMAAAMIEPNQKFMMLLLPGFSMKTKTLMIVYTVIEITSQISGRDGNTAHLAHLGGIVGGYIFTEIFLRKAILWHPFEIIFNRRKRKMKWQFFDKDITVSTPKFENKSPSSSANYVSQKELNYLLDKVSKGTINSLTPEELARLKQAREQINSNKKG